ncbi:hypothetical protein [Christiangramia salexigens]|uniref:Nicotinate-nucleotide adenylyltransferase n=1 Tax=Christiangramia salexigens TaxID=1913577 RepID=A0A1L3J3B9_9FLAO|nr:hypothetical protein [Christiangramia salexigens]APG59600.1 hypothetical protein LPB144_03880 [Christiangramia salexigens]
MKKFILLILVAGWVLNSYSQEVIHLEEAEVTFTPSAKIILNDLADGRVIVKENYARQFESNAIKFLVENFDIYGFMRANKSGDFDEYLVTVKSKKGYLRANYDSDGSLVSTFQKFKNIPLPKSIRDQVFASYNTWELTNTAYIAKSQGTQIDDEKYIVTLRKGNMKEKIKISPDKVTGTGVASIEK